MGSQQFCLRWNNHQTNMLSVFDKLLVKESFVDVTIACEGSNIKAHKMVLSACSPFFEDLFHDNPCKHPIVIMKDMKFNDLKAIIEFMYKGEVNVSQDKLAALLKTAESLKIKGLTEMLGDHPIDSDIGNMNNFQLPMLRSTYGTSPLCHTKSPTPKRKRRRHSGENKNLMISQKSKSPSPDIEELPKSPSTKDMIMPSDSVSSNKLQIDTDDNLDSSNPPLENGNERNQPVLDPSSIMQQSLTENQAFEEQQRQLDFVNHRDHTETQNSEESVGMESNSSIHPSTSSNDNIINMKKDNSESFYNEEVTHILPQPKQELLERGVTIIPVSDGVSMSSSSDGITMSDRLNAGNVIDEIDYSGSSRGQYSPQRECDTIMTGSPIGIDSYAGVQPGEHIPQSVSGHSENIESIAGPSGEQTSPGRSHGSGIYDGVIDPRASMRASGTTCHICSKTLCDRSSLSKHLRYVHCESQRISCQLCNRSFKRKTDYTFHLKSGHGIPYNYRLPVHM